MSKARPKDEQEVATYIAQNQYNVDASDFYDHMECVGWKYGRAKFDVKDWKACVRTWNKRAGKGKERVLL